MIFNNYANICAMSELQGKATYLKIMRIVLAESSCK